LAIKRLSKAGFTAIQDFSERHPNHPSADLYAELGGERLSSASRRCSSTNAWPNETRGVTRGETRGVTLNPIGNGRHIMLTAMGTRSPVG